MKRNLGPKISVAVITACLVLYFALTLRFSWLLLTGGDGVGIAIGVGLLVFPILGAIFVGREIVFGFQAQRLLQRMADEGELPVDDLPKRPSGAPERAAADAEFPTWKAAVEESPDDWHAWYRLALAYDASGDRRRARDATRRAIRLERASAGPAA